MFRRSAQPVLRSGYTLIEVLVVVVVMGIAGAVVLPSMSGAHVLKVQAAVRSVVADITFAQMDALAYQEPRGIVFDTDANRYTLIQITGGEVDLDADALYDPKGPGQRYIVDLDKADFGGAFISEVDLNGGDTLIFDELGGPVASAGSDEISTSSSVTISSPNGRFRIDIAAFTGRVTVVRLD
ncbi:MAG: prepilin-type N-terminal cleavage/methylation domain-containing protein [Planctomycetota bacterium]|nr:MAG: prepilin-type N-terminal cleavage/methylation domain-containing protein [Planctomycetota bacterium]